MAASTAASAALAGIRSPVSQRLCTITARSPPVAPIRSQTTALRTAEDLAPETAAAG